MRRSDREIVNKEQIEDIIKECKICRIAMQDENGLYIVPMNFGYKYDDKFVLYFHSAKEGRKINVIKNNPNVAFEMDCKHQLVEAKQACGYSYLYQSIIGEGKATIIDGDEKKSALQLLMKHQTGQEFIFNEQMYNSVLVFKITVNKISAKGHL